MSPSRPFILRPVDTVLLMAANRIRLVAILTLIEVAIEVSLVLLLVHRLFSGRIGGRDERGARDTRLRGPYYRNRGRVRVIDEDPL